MQAGSHFSNWRLEHQTMPRRCQIHKPPAAIVPVRRKTMGVLPSQFSKLGREFLWVIAGQVATAVGAIAGVRVLTRLLTPSTYGEFALGMTLATLTEQVVFGPLSGSTLRFFAVASETRRLLVFFQVVASLLRKAIVTAIIAAVVLIVILSRCNLEKWVPLAICAAVLSILSGCNSTLDGIQNAIESRAVVAWHQGAGQWLRVVLAVLVIRLFGAHASSAVLGYAFATTVVLTSQLAL